jgi:hypothetical protein
VFRSSSLLTAATSAAAPYSVNWFYIVSMIAKTRVSMKGHTRSATWFSEISGIEFLSSSTRVLRLKLCTLNITLAVTPAETKDTAIRRRLDEPDILSINDIDSDVLHRRTQCRVALL